jgi:hypothetical protein
MHVSTTNKAHNFNYVGTSEPTAQLPSGHCLACLSAPLRSLVWSSACVDLPILIQPPIWMDAHELTRSDPRFIPVGTCCD